MEIARTPEFTQWIDGLRDATGRARILARVRRLGDGNPGDHRKLQGGISELRVDVGPGYRVYYTYQGSDLVLLLAGGDKSSQHRNIERAQRIAQCLDD
ncbi:type II toxin-antitoxin system RelE/ParE family toxin [Stenotrophomonas sp. 278]|uniref:type II toxin-antitoxin system RelE/ParE family toxin n=1 Tax=Stenotrophomonas sp. 278 TaxID=2479851 RepID=UPI000F66CEAF|nr:type II toxin-antitoxin system RelE/ParE family toxin [Stenotrophomonas sp. 278]RRU13000.1 type II toxin-antitoxin system RelE/ParE family toxin [Stenotrophomonas sp. 278]